jgi:hypothetical protein
MFRFRKKRAPQPPTVEADRVCDVCGMLLFDDETARCGRHSGSVFGSRDDVVRGETETR